MKTKRLLMLGLVAAGVTGVLGVALSGMGNEVFTGSLVGVNAENKSVTLNKDTHVTNLTYSKDAVDGFPWYGISTSTWNAAYVGGQYSSSRINLQYYIGWDCDYTFNSGNNFVEARLNDGGIFWLSVGVNNIQSFTIDYNVGDRSLVTGFSYEFLNASFDSAGLSDSIPLEANDGSFNLSSTESATSTCRYLRIKLQLNQWLYAGGTSFTIKSLDVNYTC